MKYVIGSCRAKVGAREERVVPVKAGGRQLYLTLTKRNVEPGSGVDHDLELCTMMELRQEDPHC
jgi:hypothetical protein